MSSGQELSISGERDRGDLSTSFMKNIFVAAGCIDPVQSFVVENFSRGLSVCRNVCKYCLLLMFGQLRSRPWNLSTSKPEASRLS